MESKFRKRLEREGVVFPEDAGVPVQSVEWL